jgi:hypothetical protein
MSLDVCCKCVYLEFWMLHIFHTYVASVLSGLVSSVFLQVFQMYVLSVSSAFIRMLQVLHLDVSQIDRTLHLPPRLLLPCILLIPQRGHDEGR